MKWKLNGEKDGSVILVHADWKDHLRWRVLNYDLVRCCAETLSCGFRFLPLPLIRVQQLQQLLELHINRKRWFKKKKKKEAVSHQVVSQKEKKYLIVKSLGGTKKNIVSIKSRSSILFFLPPPPTCFSNKLRKRTHIQMHPGALKSLCREPN